VNVWKIAVAGTVTVAGLAAAVAYGGGWQGVGMLIYLLAVGSVALIALARRLGDALPRAAPFERLVAQQPRPPGAVKQLEMIRRGLSAAGWNDAELRFRLGPMVREIAAARLSRRYGIDLERQPVRARAVLGDGRVWELTAPRRPPPGRDAGGWSARELAELLDELEAI
jgi:hypothetical protein